MKTSPFLYRLITILFVLALATPMVHADPKPTLAVAALPGPAISPTNGIGSGLFRTQVSIGRRLDLDRLAELGVALLRVEEDRAIVLADDEQLQALARLRFKPTATDELGTFLAVQGPERAWLQTSLQPLVDQGLALQGILSDKAAAVEAMASARGALRDALHGMTAEQRAGLAASSSLDDDADGLTNTEEAWWCTDPLNPNSDGDAQGYTDGQEVAALLDFSLPRDVRWSYGPPFGPPNPWPNFNNQNGSGVNVCNDGDWDTVPDYAEAYVVGTRVGVGNSENTDGDKFDDGQEFFGITYCPGGSTTCGYGSYPRTQDYSFITSGMPSWVRPPGDSPFVAAYPVIEFLVDPATIRVVTREIRTSERTITQGEEISTGFAETTGSSTTVGTIDTNTHSTWQENSTTEGGIEPTSLNAAIGTAENQNDWDIPLSTPAPLVAELENRALQAAKDQPALCWGVGMDQTFVDGLSETERSVCTTVLSAAKIGDPTEQADDKINLDENQELLLTKIAEYVSNVDSKTYVWIEGSVRNRHRSYPELYSEVYAILPLQGDISSVFFAGSRPFNGLLNTVPDSLASYELKDRLAQLAEPAPQPSNTHFYLPYTKGESLNIYNQPIHGGTWAWDFQTAPSGTILRATRPGRVYAYDKHTQAGCDSSLFNYANWVLIDHTDGTASLYLHLRANGALKGKAGGAWGEWVDQGTPVAVSGNTGYSTPCPGGVHHLHFQVQAWKGIPTWKSSENRYQGVFNYDSYRVRFEEYPDTDVLPSPARSQNPYATSNQNACYVPGMTSAITGQPIYFNQQQKPISFGETIGKLFQGFVGKLTRSGSLEELTLAPDSLSGCAGDSCSDQVRYQTSNSLNFSDNRSGGQCSSAGGSPGGDSSSGFGGGGAGMAINNNGDGTWDRLRVWSQTTTTGEGFSTSHSELRSQTEYSEITRSQTNTLVSSEAWSTATTVDPTQAATLTFNYNLYNTGSDAAVQLTGVRINILIGDLPVITWNAPDRANILPGQAKGPFGSDPVNLTLDQLAAIDNGAPIRVVLADYGYNDSLYDQDAWGRGVLFHVEDGIADGDESSDTTLITTGLVQGETYQDVLARYFPVEVFDAGPNDPRTATLTNIRTPEFDANGEITAWNDHRVGERGWWELAVSLGGETPGVQNFKDMPAKPRTDVYLRYVEDSDGDGYSDRAEIDGMSDPNNPDIHPRPLMIAAQHRQISGSTATVQLALQNIGNFDASSVEVWAVAPDDSITLTDNLIGGGGRVEAGGHVVLGARTGNLNLANWAIGTAKPYPAGQYTGLTAKTFTLRADGSGNIGGTTDLTISWSTDGATWTPLAVGAGYTTLAPLALSDGLTVAFSTGYIAHTETFSFQAALPIDTFSYTINRTPHTPPLIVVSYNDPAGNHKFVSDVEVTPIQADLTGYLGQMRYGFELDIMAETPAAPGANTAYLVFTNPADQAIHQGKLFVEFALPDGTVAKEYVLADQTFQPGPNVVTLLWNTADFNPAFDPAAEYQILVFAADRQGTIFENTVKKLSQIGHDRLPLAVLPVTSWDFGPAQQGSLLKHTIAVANVGYHDLLTFVQGNPGFTLSDSGTRHLPGGDLALYELTLNTAQLPVGPFQSTVTIRTSDPTQPSHTVTIQGTVTAMPVDVPPGAVQRPLDWSATFASGTQGQWVEFTHTLGPTPQTLHPVKVYSQNYAALWGVGKYATAFAAGTAPGDMFGDGRDGTMPTSGNLDNNNGVGVGTVNGSAGSTNVTVIDRYAVWRIKVGDVVLIHQSRGNGVGKWEFNRAASDFTGSGTFALQKPLSNSYVTNAGNERAQILRVPQYSTCNVTGTITPISGWNGDWGGILSVLCSGTMTVNGSVNASGGGYLGGSMITPPAGPCGVAGHQGEGIARDRNTRSTSSNENGGGGGWECDNNGGAGGGHATAGARGHGGYSVGGIVVGEPTLTNTMMLGGGGGSGAPGNAGMEYGGYGGNGGGIILIAANTIAVNGTITASGTDGQGGSYAGRNVYGGGGGAGGSVKLLARTASIGTNRLQVNGGSGGASTRPGGAGGVGRIRIEYCESLTGTTSPSASTQPISCHNAEQIESSPYDQSRLRLPETFASSRTYQVQFGRRMVFASTGNQDVVLRVPAGALTSVVLNALVSGVGTGSLTLRLDVGNNGSWDWEYTGSVTDAATLTSPSLSAAFSAYWATQSTRPLNGTLDVPVRVSLSKAGQVLLTNLQVTPTGRRLRHIRLPAQAYNEVIVGLTAGQSGSGALTVAADVGDNGSVDWAWSDSATYPQALTTDNLATAINAYLQGQTGEVDVPIRFYVSPFVEVNLQGVTATPAAQSDVSLSASDIVFSAATPSEGDVVTVTATLHNLGSLDSGPLTASFFATPAGGLERYIGSDFVSSVPPSSSSPAAIPWNTLGFTGDVSVRVVVDPYNRVVESDEDNNQANKPITILTRPDLEVTSVTLSDDEPVAGNTIDVTLGLANHGQTTAAPSTLALYTGHPDSGGALICEQPISVVGNGQDSVTCPWTTGAAGPQRLLAMVDRNNVVAESNEGNNQNWHDVYVGFAGPLLLDSGGSSDPEYTEALGYGYLNGEASSFCGGDADQTQRSDGDGLVTYRFDHLLPGHFYHLDLALYQCDGPNPQRLERILIDDQAISDDIAIGDGQVHRLSYLLDPAFYKDHSIVVGVEEVQGHSAVVSQVNLIDMDYRYADAGGANDPQHPGSQRYGWLDGAARTPWGTLPYQSRRIDEPDSNPADDPDNELRYRFDGLQADRRYQLNMTFYQGSAGVVQQTVNVDGLDTGAAVSLNGVQRQDISVDVPIGAHAQDGSIVVRIVRTDSTANAFVNEISLEQKTLLTLPAIRDVQVANVADTSATISWLTDRAAKGTVSFGATPSLGQVAQDERGPNTSGRTHSVALIGLTPSTTYYFYVTSADTLDDNNGALYQFTTGPTLAPTAPDQVYGQVFLPDGVTLATDTVVYVTVRNSDGQGSTGHAAPLSDVIVTGDDGYWNVNLGNARTANNQQTFQYSPEGDQVHLIASDGSECSAEQVVDTSNDAPAPAMTLTCPTQMTHNLSVGWNLLGLNVISDPLPTAEDALDDIETQGGNASEIDRWINGGWDAHIHNLPFNNFGLELGKGYFLRSSVASAWQRNGRPASNPLLLTLAPGWNLVSFPKLSCPLGAEQALDEIEAQGGNCSEIDRWLNGGWSGHIHNLPFNPFAIATDQGYFLKCSLSSTYLPCQGAAERVEPAAPEPVETPVLQPASAPAIADVLVTNRRDVALTITWRTDLPSDGWVEYGLTAELGQAAYDQRGRDTVSTLHQVTLAGLTPETTYYLRVRSGNSAGDDGKPIQATTAPTTPPTTPFLAYGQVFNGDGSPAVGALVVVRLGADQDQRSEPFSALVDGAGYWALSLPVDVCETASLALEIVNPQGQGASLSLPACSAQSAPAVQLKE